MHVPSPPYGHPPVPPAYPGRPRRRRTRAGTSVLLPVVGVTLAAVGVLVLPWSEGTWSYTVVGSRFEDRSTDFGRLFAVGFAYPSLLLGGLLAFAANLDSAVLRWLHFGLGALLTCGCGTLGMIGAGIAGATLGNEEGQAAETGGAWVAASACVILVVLAAWLGFAFLKGLALRIVGGLLLLGYALVAALGIVTLYQDYPTSPYPWAFAPALGWMLCAIGAFSGPRYHWV